MFKFFCNALFSVSVAVLAISPLITAKADGEIENWLTVDELQTKLCSEVHVDDSPKVLAAQKEVVADKLYVDEQGSNQNSIPIKDIYVESDIDFVAKAEIEKRIASAFANKSVSIDEMENLLKDVADIYKDSGEATATAHIVQESGGNITIKVTTDGYFDKIHVIDGGIVHDSVLQWANQHPSEPVTTGNNISSDVQSQISAIDTIATQPVDSVVVSQVDDDPYELYRSLFPEKASHYEQIPNEGVNTEAVPENTPRKPTVKASYKAADILSDTSQLTAEDIGKKVLKIDKNPIAFDMNSRIFTFAKVYL